jgi:hypothetical protein
MSGGSLDTDGRIAFKLILKNCGCEDEDWIHVALDWTSDGTF